jgi:hypothetical protein
VSASLGHCLAEVLAVVQHQQQRAVGQQAKPARHASLPEVGTGHAQRQAQGCVHLARLGHLGQVDEQGLLCGLEPLRHHGLGQPGLAHARWAQQGHEAMLLQKAQQAMQVGFAAEHRCQEERGRWNARRQAG